MKTWMNRAHIQTSEIRIKLANGTSSPDHLSALVDDELQIYRL